MNKFQKFMRKMRDDEVYRLEIIFKTIFWMVAISIVTYVALSVFQVGAHQLNWEHNIPDWNLFKIILG